MSTAVVWLAEREHPRACIFTTNLDPLCFLASTLLTGMRDRVGYALDASPTGIHRESDVVWVDQDNSLVMLGGEVWPAGWAVCHHLQRFLSPLLGGRISPITIVELGAGAGLCGLVAAAVSRPRRVILTDQDIELCAINASTFTAAHPDLPKVEVAELMWGMPVPAPLTIEPNSVGLIIGVEITPMRCSHAALVSTLSSLCPKGSSTCAVLTIDACHLMHDKNHDGDIYPATCPGAKACAGHAFLELAARAGFRWTVAEIWSSDEIKALCEDRRVVVSTSEETAAAAARQKDGKHHKMNCGSRRSRHEFAATADDVVIVHLTRCCCS